MTTSPAASRHSFSARARHPRSRSLPPDCMTLPFSRLAQEAGHHHQIHAGALIRQPLKSRNAHGATPPELTIGTQQSAGKRQIAPLPTWSELGAGYNLGRRQNPRALLRAMLKVCLLQNLVVHGSWLAFRLTCLIPAAPCSFGLWSRISIAPLPTEKRVCPCPVMFFPALCRPS